MAGIALVMALGMVTTVERQQTEATPTSLSIDLDAGPIARLTVAVSIPRFQCVGLTPETGGQHAFVSLRLTLLPGDGGSLFSTSTK